MLDNYIVHLQIVKMSHKILLQTINFAALAHRNQRRKDPDSTPYINHPIGVANLISTVGNDDDLVTLQAALLHDTIEDTDVTYEDLVEHFGNEVADIVVEVSDDKSLSKVARKKKQIEHSAHISNRAKTVKFADKLYNIRDLARSPPNDWSLERVQGYFLWAFQVVNKMRGTNAGLEAELDNFFDGKFTFQGVEYLVIKNRNNINEQLEKYYALF